MRAGIMGGTFDPVHFGHLFVAEVARHQLKLDRVIWVPSRRPPHKLGATVTPPEQRVEMLRLAVANNPKFEISTFEVDRAGPGYSLDTVRYLRGCLPSYDLWFIIGADSAFDLPTWHRPTELMAECRFAAVSRPGFDLRQLHETVPAEYLRRIDLIPSPGLEISGTTLRERVRCGEPIRYLVPDEVDRYVADRRLYR